MRPSPADVGRRVVVRHRLADGRASDVVGELRWWDDEHVRVLADRGGEGGALVVVRAADVVAARVVGSARAGATGAPVTPAARSGDAAQPGGGDPLGATVDVAARRTALGWVAPDEARLGGWLLRASTGPMMRASSALAVGDPGRPTGEALAAVARHYLDRSQVPAVQVSAPVPRGSAPGGTSSGGASSGGAPGEQAGDELEEALARDGWQPQPWTVLALRPTPGAPRPSPAARPATRGTRVGQAAQPGQIRVAPSAGPAWLAASDHHGSPLVRADLPPERDGVTVAHAGASAPGTGGVTDAGDALDAGGRGGAAPLVAVARGALAQRWLGITCVSVAPAHRRRGLAGALGDALLDHLGGPPATDALYVQVVASNAVARAAWRALGFVDHSRYRFWTLPRGA